MGAEDESDPHRRQQPYNLTLSGVIPSLQSFTLQHAAPAATALGGNFSGGPRNESTFRAGWGAVDCAAAPPSASV